MVSPVMKETANSCRCKSAASCNCSRKRATIRSGGNGAVNLPLEFNLQNLINQNQVFPTQTELVNHLALQALIASSTVPRDAYPSELFGAQNWPPLPKYGSETAHVVSSSDQIIRQRSPSGKRRKKKEERISPAPLSPPVSTSSPLTSRSPIENNNTSVKLTSKGKKYVCNICQRSFDYKHVLQNHERTHTGEKPFKCPQCQKKFTRDHHLKTHMRLHTGEKPYKCEHCPKDFVQVANLRRHTRVHTGERPYSCDICPSKFSDSNQLKAHMLIHSGQKPFACGQCNGQYRRKHHLNNHKCVKNGLPASDDVYIKSEPVIKREDIDIMEEDDDSKCDMSDDTVSSDSGMSASFSSRLQTNGYHQPWITAPPTVMPIPSQLSPVSISNVFGLSSMVTIPVQTEPEDLSVNKKHRSANNNNSSGSAADSSRSTSPMEEDNLSPVMS